MWPLPARQSLLALTKSHVLLCSDKRFKSYAAVLPAVLLKLAQAVLEASLQWRQLRRRKKKRRCSACEKCFLWLELFFLFCVHLMLLHYVWSQQGGTLSLPEGLFLPKRKIEREIAIPVSLKIRLAQGNRDKAMEINFTGGWPMTQGNPSRSPSSAKLRGRDGSSEGCGMVRRALRRDAISERSRSREVEKWIEEEAGPQDRRTAGPQDRGELRV